MPSFPLVTSMKSASVLRMSVLAAFLSESSSTILTPEAASASFSLGVIALAPEYLVKLSPLGSTVIKIPASFASFIVLEVIFSVITPFA